MVSWQLIKRSPWILGHTISEFIVLLNGRQPNGTLDRGGFGPPKYIDYDPPVSQVHIPVYFEY